MEKQYKIFVEVDVHFDSEGIMWPTKMYWGDGRAFEIDRITDMRQAASFKAGGQGIRYTCWILGKERYLWYEAPKWFVEAK